MPTALIFGVNGQDGSYLAQHLSSEGIRVVGVGKSPTVSSWLVNAPMQYICNNIVNVESIPGILNTVIPDEIYYFAAVHGSSGFSYEPNFQSVMAVNTVAVHPILEYMRENPQSRMVYASSSKVFGSDLHGMISENSPRQSTCLYSLSKLSAENLIRYYKDKFNINAGYINFFQHESQRRAESYFIPKLARNLAACIANPHHTVSLKTLDFFCDWGDAEEYMRIVVCALRHAPGEDFVFATGQTTYAHTLVEKLCDTLNLPFKKIFASELCPMARKPAFEVNIDKMKRILGCYPQNTIFSLCLSLVRQFHNRGEFCK